MAYDLKTKWKLPELTIAGSTAMSSFAFAYVVGYFSVFDIAWFPFFTLQEHIVFALRAIPIAIAVTAILLVPVTISTLELTPTTDEQSNPKTSSQGHLESLLIWSQTKGSWWIFSGWLILLTIVMLYFLEKNHFGFGVSVLMFIIGSIVTHIERSRLYYIVRYAYWSANILFVCFIFGMISGESSKLYTCFPSPHIMTAIANDREKVIASGHVIFSGAAGVLLYDYKRKMTILARWNGLSEIDGCTPKTQSCTLTSDTTCSAELVNLVSGLWQLIARRSTP